MAKRRVVNLIDGGWWVWLCGASAQIVASESDARELMARSFEADPHAEHDITVACPAVKVVWSDPLPPGEDHHKIVLLPIHLILHRGVPRKTMPPMTSREVKAMNKSWAFEDGDFAADHPLGWLELSRQAINDPEVLVLRKLGRQRITPADQLDRRWPAD